MEMNEESIKNLWVIVEKTHKQVLAMKFLGEFKAYVVSGFSTKESYGNERGKYQKFMGNSRKDP